MNQRKKNQKKKDEPKKKEDPEEDDEPKKEDAKPPRVNKKFAVVGKEEKPPKGNWVDASFEDLKGDESWKGLVENDEV